ncbi:DNA-binding protein WhiA [Ligilactobacillus pobuzihii]|uniref:Probable cell division protein WhiA n=1 Tax=Ligilactobacillus pobuzihii TaxID=449659 RepID=A0A0R2LE77_9LACO|nr:DNA-binding protein WhiA [Ligilactobacillus pobuzihii]KRK10545.1 sporulation transcription regulator whiA [Ligilactobacillus pobuzihii E100301 = KCTC 13174]KRN97418.1 sporulation transcription regulator whiA [Ligilactobacillus pobuzihii]GEN48083.1 putative sporulation transcription regulator WhiA [Ligilactobacillus pobuzihii]
MSYASDVKKELTTLEVDHLANGKAELMALIRMNGALNLLDHQFVLSIQTENPATARRIYWLLEKFYGIKSELMVRRKMKLKKNNLYIVRLRSGSSHVLQDLDIIDGLQIKQTVNNNFLSTDGPVRSYLRGAFLATGSVNNPETSRYHLEIYSLYEEHNNSICEMMNHYHLNARKTERRSGYITYLKEGEKIADFLSLIGATSSMLKFEDIRIMRDMRNSVNRIVNCENANLNKVADAATKQIENIKLIDDIVGLNKLPVKLQQVAITRVTHPEVSLKELGDLVEGGPISKSGVNHRLRKINEYADKVKNGTFDAQNV